MSATGGYRDEGGSLREELAGVEREIEALERSFTKAFWKEVAPRVSLGPRRTSTEAERARAEKVRGDRDALEALLRERRARLAELELGAQLVPLTDEGFRTPIAGAALALRPGDAEWSPFREPLKFTRGGYAGKLGECVRKALPDATLYSDPASMPLFFEARGVPFSTRLGYEKVSKREEQLACEVATTVAPGATSMKLGIQDMTVEFLKLLRLSRDVDVGDELFDAMFLVHGDAALVRATLVPALRAALLALARTDVPRVEVEHGIATVRWFEPGILSGGFAALFEVLAQLRAAPVTGDRVSFVKPYRNTG